MNSIDFHLFYDRNNQPRLSISKGANKTYAVVLNKSFASMLTDLAAIIETSDDEMARATQMDDCRNPSQGNTSEQSPDNQGTNNPDS